jgi:hypothetical protein
MSKNGMNAWLMSGVLLCSMLCVPQVAAEGAKEEGEVVPVVSGKPLLRMKKVVYSDVDSRWVMDKHTNRVDVYEALLDMGLRMPEGANAQYSMKKKTLTMVNTEEEHQHLKEALEKFKTENPPEAEKAIEFIDSCKTLAGKPNKKAKVYVFFVVSPDDVEIAEEVGFDGPSLYDSKEQYKKWIKAVSKLQKKREVEVIMLLLEDMELKSVKKLAKALKVKAPILKHNASLIRNKFDIEFLFGCTTILERSGEQIEFDSSSWWTEGGNCLEVVEACLQGNAPKRRQSSDFGDDDEEEEDDEEDDAFGS